MRRVISGGQAGVDIAALRAAKRVGIATGGWMPCGFRTLSGPRRAYKEIYGMRESGSAEYAPRTICNVTDSAATLRIAQDFASPGERCTLRAILDADRPHFDLGLVSLSAGIGRVDAADDWLRSLGPITLNVAGNSEHTAPGIEAAAEAILLHLFSRWIRT